MPPLDGMMLGRAAYQDPELLIGVDPLLFGEPAPVADAFEAVEAYMPYVEARLAEGFRLHSMTRHMLGLFPGRPGARAWRRHLATEAVKPGAGVHTLRDALALVSREKPRRRPPELPQCKAAAGTMHGSAFRLAAAFRLARAVELHANVAPLLFPPGIGAFRSPASA